MSTSRRWVNLLVIAAIVWSGPVRAQVPMFLGTWNAGITGGASIPTGNFSNAYYAGWTVGAWVAYHEVGTSLSGRAMYSYQRFTASLPTSPTINANGIAGEVVGHLPAVYARPYLLGGLGGYHLTDAGWKLGWHAGGGLAFTILNHTTLFEAKYLSMGNAFNTVPVTIGLVF